MKPHRAALVVTAFLASSVCLVLACGSSSTGNGNGPQDSGSGQDITTTDTGSGGDTGVSGDGGTDGSSADGSLDGPASHLAFPQITNGGVPTMASPKVVSITFQGDTMAPQLDTFGQGVTQSSWYTTVIKDYCPSGAGTCVGQAGVSDPMTTAAAASYVDTATGDPSQLPDSGTPLWTLLTSEIDTGAVPPPDDNTLYMFYFPAQTNVNLDGALACNSFDGYHNQMAYTNDAGVASNVVYGVSMECQGYMLSDVTLTSSHEIVEAATDGLTTQNGYGWYLNTPPGPGTDPNTLGWNDILGGETADMCVDILGYGQDHTPEGSFTAQRIWSISRAALGENPCIPIPAGQVYFNAAPEKAMFVMSVGETRTFQVTGFSDAPFPDWTLTLQDWSVDANGNPVTYLDMSVMGGSNQDAGPQVSLNNGSVVTVSMKLLSDPSPSVNGEADGVLVSSDNPDLNKATKANVWPFVVMTAAEADADGVSEPARKRPRQAGMSLHGASVRPPGAQVHRGPRLTSF